MTRATTGSDASTAEQLAAIACDEHDILLEAGAGSGKTRTTVERYMSLIEGRTGKAEADPAAILVFTFTDKAATELRDEVRRRRSETSDPGDFSMSSAWVGTFHAICLRILRSYPIAADVDPKFTVLDDVNAETVKATAFRRTLIEFATDEEREYTLGLFRDGPLRESVTAAYEELRSRGRIEPRLPDFSPTDPATGLEALRATLGPTLELEELKGGQRDHVQAMSDLFSGTQLHEIRREDVVAHMFGSGVPAFQSYLKACRAAIAGFTAFESGDRVRRHLGELLEIYGRRYAEAKRDVSMLDYEDLQLITVKLLRKYPGIADSYRTRFAEIMVDEFQDTNRLQLELIELLRGPDTRLFTVGDEMQAIYGFRHADVELFRARRRAEGVKVLPLSANFRSQAPIIGAVNEIGATLDAQAEASHASGGTGERHRFAPLTVGAADDGDPSWAELHLTEKKGWKPLNLGDLSPAIDSKTNVGKPEDGHFEAEALSLAHRLRDLVDQGRFSQKQIVVLLRAKTRIELYRNALEQVGLSPYIVGGTGFWQSREATDLRSLLALLANPLDDEALIAVATSPACGLSTDALWLLRKAAGRDQPLWTAIRRAAEGDSGEQGDRDRLDHLPGEDVDRICELVDRVDEIRAKAPLAPLPATVESVFTATGYDLASLTRNPDGTGLANLRRVVTLAHEYEATNGRDLREFLNWIELSAALDSESPAASIDENSDVIRLMTVHKAKGLEFDLVCLPDLKRSNGSNQEGKLILGKPADPDRPDDFPVGMRLPNLSGPGHKLYDWESLAAVQKTAEADEELRLFHVALTRARRALILSGITTGKAPAKISESTSMSDRVVKAFAVDPTAEDPPPIEIAAPSRAITGPEPAGTGISVPGISVQVNRAKEEVADLLATSEARIETGEASQYGRPPLKRPERVLYPDVPLSFTAIGEYTHCPTQFFAKRVLRLEQPEALDPFASEEPGLGRREEATGFGLAVHDLLETAGRNRWRQPDRKSIDEALRARGLDPRAEGAGDRAGKMISAFLSTELAGRIQAGESSVELPLLARVGGVTIRGFADLVLKNPAAPLVLDYKTNRLDGVTPAEKMDDYLLQRDLYALAVYRTGGADSVETAFVFLEEPDSPVFAEYSPVEIMAGEDRLAGVVEEIKGGRFFGGPGARFQPCGECRACDTLAGRRARAA